MNNNVTIIIRSVGERTEQPCRELILAQGVSPANVVIVREAPFSAAMRKSFEMGLERGLPWTFCVDADLLLRPNSVETMLQLAEEQPEHVCEIQGYILDKFFGGPRHGGVHLYRTSLLPEVIANIPAEGVNIRPEFHTLETMKGQGYPYVIAPYLVGLHDFEQYYQDIFRKCFVQAHKHQQLTELFLSIWRNSADEDIDYRVALQAYAAGIAHYKAVHIDTRQEIYRQEFARLEICEKGPLPVNSYSLGTVEHMITTWVEPKLYTKYFPTKLGLEIPPDLNVVSRQEKIAQQAHRLGIIRIIPYAAGWLLCRAGQSLKGWANGLDLS